MAAEVRDDVAASSPLAALTMTKETSKTGLFILVVCSKVKRKLTDFLKESVVYKTCRGKPERLQADELCR